MQQNKGNLLALGSIPLMMTLGNSMLIPVLPEIGRKLHVSSFRISMLITVYAVVAILLIPIAGYLSDRFGRKAVIVPCLILTVIGGGISAAGAWLLHDSAAYWTIIGGRLLQGAGAAGAFPIVIPLVGDLYENEDEASKNLGVVETYNTFGKVLSPILGAALGAVLWFMPLAVIPGLCLISLILVLWLIHVPKRKNQPIMFREFVGNVKRVLAEKGRWLYAIFAMGGICMFVIFGVLFYLSDILESRYNLRGVWKGFVLAIPLISLCLCSYVGGKIIGKHKKRMKWIGFSGLAILTISFAILGFFQHIYAVIGLFTLGGGGIGLALPCLDALITKGIEKEERGTITSLYSSMRFVGVSLGPPVVSLLLGRSGHGLLFGVMAAVGGIAALLMLFAVKPKQDEPTDDKSSDRMSVNEELTGVAREKPLSSKLRSKTPAK
ncbi:MFS transporter [Paenibacillus sp. S25]|uniref:MFS transporter n=1 Tax=Paenibacillus sp. S25 TaxID=2823905 RepID=UPI001C6476A1|nr:MFS transporter [Paenibacillus sp. S25]QYK61523.1 Bacillibactin exporter [Paenibacillus sp. S25]